MKLALRLVIRYATGLIISKLTLANVSTTEKLAKSYNATEKLQGKSVRVAKCGQGLPNVDKEVIGVVPCGMS